MQLYEEFLEMNPNLPTYRSNLKYIEKDNQGKFHKFTEEYGYENDYGYHDWYETEQAYRYLTDEKESIPIPNDKHIKAQFPPVEINDTVKKYITFAKKNRDDLKKSCSEFDMFKFMKTNDKPLVAASLYEVKEEEVSLFIILLYNPNTIQLWCIFPLP